MNYDIQNRGSGTYPLSLKQEAEFRRLMERERTPASKADIERLERKLEKIIKLLKP